MYQTDFVCTYKIHSPEDQPDMYRIQLLQAFNMTKWDDANMNRSTLELFQKIGTHSDIREILEKARKSKCCESIIDLIDNNDYTLFMNLFQYELFHLFHRCICDIFSQNKVTVAHKNMLFEAMK